MSALFVPPPLSLIMVAPNGARRTKADHSALPMTIAETGHLVLATLHTNSAVQSINRIIDLYPPHQQSQIRAQMSLTLEAVLSQQLLMRSSGVGRVLCAELMMTTPAIRNLIREDKVHQIYSQMLVGQAKYGKQTMNQSLSQLYEDSQIAYEDAINHSNDVEELRHMIHGTDGPASKSPVS